MTFWQEVYRLRKERLIPRVWKRRHLMKHLKVPDGDFRENTVGVYPANSSISLKHYEIGDYVKRGQEPKAWRIGPPRSGEYQLIVDPEDDDTTQQEQRATALARAEELRSGVGAINGLEVAEAIGVPTKQHSVGVHPPQSTSSEDVAAKLQDVLNAMYDKRRYPLRGKVEKYERPHAPAMPVSDWDVLNDRP